MLDLSVELKNFSKTGLRFQRVLAQRAAIAQEELNKFGETAVQKLAAEAYPAQLPNQKYVRTFLLRNRFQWKARPLQKSGRILLSNTAPNRRFAIGKKSQARIHQGRWWTMQDKVQGYTPALHRALLAAYMERLTNG
jgi:hypothetical protein